MHGPVFRRRVVPRLAKHRAAALHPGVTPATGAASTAATAGLRLVPVAPTADWATRLAQDQQHHTDDQDDPADRGVSCSVDTYLGPIS